MIKQFLRYFVKLDLDLCMTLIIDLFGRKISAEEDSGHTKVLDL